MSDAAMLAASLDIAEGTYGAATDEVRRIIGAAAGLRWFPVLDADSGDVEAVRSSLAQHFRLMGNRSPHVSDAGDAKFIRGGWEVLGEAYRRANPVGVGDDPAYARVPWRRALGELAGDLHRTLKRSRAALIVPPLFPFEGNATIVGGMLTTDAGQRSAIVDDTKWRDTIWYLMCDVDSDFWSAIAGALVSDDPRSPSAFSVLVRTTRAASIRWASTESSSSSSADRDPCHCVRFKGLCAITGG